jgi:molybdopterin molybdotransferase
VVLHAGKVIRPAEVGVLATLGATHVRVPRRPRVAILSTGDELVPVGAPLAPGTIYDANAETLNALVEWYGAEPLTLGIARDDKDVVWESLRAGVARGADLILTSGGVSVGTHDVVKAVLAEHGAIDFWSVAMRPGRPLVLGRIESVPVVALPGNPVSVMVDFELFVRPALLRLAGHALTDRVELLATALEPMHAAPGRETFLRGVVCRAGERAGAGWEVRTTGGQGSGMLTSMARANALIHLGGDQTEVAAGDDVRVWILDAPFGVYPTFTGRTVPGNLEERR